MRHPNDLVRVYLPQDSTKAEQTPSPGLGTSLSVKTPPHLRDAQGRAHAPSKYRLESAALKAVCDISSLAATWDLYDPQRGSRCDGEPPGQTKTVSDQALMLDPDQDEQENNRIGCSRNCVFFY